ncbi:MAG: AAA family ATPase [Desulfobacteraceae bacterium]|nr:MAG: AAA family ATPase [Desulfobacteraceae bacterium]
MTDADSAKDLLLIIQSRIPIVVIESHEEAEVLAIVSRLSRQINMPAFCWTITDGLVHLDDQVMQVTEPRLNTPETVLKEIKTRVTPGIYLMTDFAIYLNDNPRVVRLLKEIAMGCEYMKHSILLLSHKIELPEDLKPFSAQFEMPVPDPAKLEKIVMEEGRQWAQNTHEKFRINREALHKLVMNLAGLTLSDARRLARKAIYDDGVITESDLPEVNTAKYKLLDMDGLLSFEYETAHFADVGGLKNLISWLESRKSAFLHQANPCVSAPDVPKGIMLVGVQGTGKSLAAKAVAGAWGLPLLRLDFAILYNKFFGETERNMRKALKMAETMAPCVLWIDEIEKGIATGDYDSGTSRRVLGSFLTWMSERKKAVFIVATSNDITSLPPELIRKGRLDEIFFVDLPDETDRQDIFRIHLSRRGMPPDAFDLKRLSDASDGFSGAEIEQAVVSALYCARSAGREMATGLIIDEIEKTSPLSIVMAEHISSLRQWAEGRTVRAN